MGTLFTGVTEVIKNMMTLFNTVLTGLLDNPLYIIIIGFAILGTLISIISYISYKITVHNRYIMADNEHAYYNAMNNNKLDPIKNKDYYDYWNNK